MSVLITDCSPYGTINNTRVRLDRPEGEEEVWDWVGAGGAAARVVGISRDWNILI